MTDRTPALLAARELAVARARTLARHGRYAEAASVLDDLPDDLAVLDLRARIHAQQGQFDQADECWARAERLAPGNSEVAAGRRRIARMRRTTRMRGGAGRPVTQVVPLAGGALAAALALALLIDIRLTQNGAPPAAQASAGQASAARASSAPQVQASPSQATTSPGADVLAAMDLKVPGVRLRNLPGQISITFTSGLFTDGATLSADGRAVLDALGARLRPYAAQVGVAIVGYTDGLPVPTGGVYADNVELGLLRAQVAAADLSAVSGIPMTRLSVSSMGDEQPPFPAASGTPQPRDRTVILWVAPAGEG